MSIVRVILRYNIIKAFVTIFIFLIAVFIFLILSHLVSLINISIFSAYISVVNNFIAIFVSLIALSIPFVMKDIEQKKNVEAEKESMRIILKRLEAYLNLPVRPSDESRFPSQEMPYFLSLSKNNPSKLLKLGIEVESQLHLTSGFKYSTLHILDKYKLYFTLHGTKLEKVDFYGQYRDIYTEAGISEKIIDEIKKKCYEDYKIQL